jgi:hypothetical protein
VHSVPNRETGLSRLSRHLSESVAVFEPNQDHQTTDLQDRLKAVFKGLEDRAVSADALFDVLRLEVLDWRIDHQIEVETLTEPVAQPDPVKTRT